MNNIVKNHKDYCMDIIYYNLHGYAVFGGLVREERRFERHGRADAACLRQQSYSRVS